jgi:hypothetical protein
LAWGFAVSTYKAAINDDDIANPLPIRDGFLTYE